MNNLSILHIQKWRNTFNEITVLNLMSDLNYHKVYHHFHINPGIGLRLESIFYLHVDRAGRLHYSPIPLTLRRLMSYIYMEHPFLMFLDHTQRRSTVGRTPLDE